MGKQNPHITNLKVLVIGCTPLARKVIDILKDISDIVGIVGLDEAEGRKKSNYDNLASFEDAFDMLWTNDINSTADWIRWREPDVIIQCGWSQIFKPCILEIPKKYCLGIHPSPLPEGRGAAIINWKIIESNGIPVKWGNSLFVMEAKTDAGPVLDFEPFIIEVRDDIRTVYQKVDQTAITMIKRTIPKIAKEIEQVRLQDETKITRYYKRIPEDGKIHLSWSAIKINDYVRALTHPYPGAYFETKFGKLFVWKVSIDSCKIHGDPGYIYNIIKGKGVLVKVDGFVCVWLERVSWKGAEKWADEWVEEVGLQQGGNIIE